MQSSTVSISDAATRAQNPTYSKRVSSIAMSASGSVAPERSAQCTRYVYALYLSR